MASDSPADLIRASESVCLGAAWQRCPVHIVRDVLAKVSKGSGKMIVATMPGRQFKAEQMLTGAAVDIAA